MSDTWRKRRIAELEAQLDHLLHPSQGETVTLQSRLDDMTAVATSLKAQLADAEVEIGRGRIADQEWRKEEASWKRQRDEALAAHERFDCTDCTYSYPCPTVEALTGESE